MAATIEPTGTPLGDMVEAVGLAIAAHIRRLGSGHPPWHLALAITRAGLLAPRPRQITWYPSV